MRSTRFGLLFFLLICGLLGPGTAAAASDPFFPATGDGSYDALAYDVRLAYQENGSIRASTTVELLTKERFTRFKLDFLGPRVREVVVNGERTRFTRNGGWLTIRIGEPVPEGTALSTTIRYQGRPPKVTDPDGSQEGWFRTDDGVVAVGEPQGTAAWIPCNNLPADKASFRFELTVPAALKAVANGRLEGVVRRGGRARYTWVEAAPMSPYLAVLDIGRGELVESRAAGRPSWTLLDPRLAKRSRPVVASLPGVIHFLSGVFGPYPFDSAGSIVDYAPDLGYALETQSRPVYAYVPDLTTLVHEAAHQWFGNSVGLERWPEIWLNEGFATWAQWYYAERHRGRSAEAIFARLYRVPASNEDFWNPPPGHPGTPQRLFDHTIYVRGAMAVQALRQAIGTEALLRVLRRWTREHRHGSATIKQFIALAERVSGRNLDPLFQRWLYQPGKPR